MNKKVSKKPEIFCSIRFFSVLNFLRRLRLRQLLPFGSGFVKIEIDAKTGPKRKNILTGKLSTKAVDH